MAKHRKWIGRDRLKPPTVGKPVGRPKGSAKVNQLEVENLAAKNFNNGEIARKLKCSTKTVQRILSRKLITPQKADWLVRKFAIVDNGIYKFPDGQAVQVKSRSWQDVETYRHFQDKWGNVIFGFRRPNREWGEGHWATIPIFCGGYSKTRIQKAINRLLNSLAIM